MADVITVTGVVGTEPTQGHARDTDICNFRLASGLRRFDKASGNWTDYGTNWYNVAAYRYLADNALKSLHKGDHIIVTGRLRVRDWESGGKRGTAVDIDAEAIGHDLTWGTSVYRKHSTGADETVEAEPAPNDEAEGYSAAPQGGDAFVPAVPEPPKDWGAQREPASVYDARPVP